MYSRDAIVQTRRTGGCCFCFCSGRLDRDQPGLTHYEGSSQLDMHRSHQVGCIDLVVRYLRRLARPESRIQGVTMPQVFEGCPAPLSSQPAIPQWSDGRCIRTKQLRRRSHVCLSPDSSPVVAWSASSGYGLSRTKEDPTNGTHRLLSDR